MVLWKPRRFPRPQVLYAVCLATSPIPVVALWKRPPRGAMVRPSLISSEEVTHNFQWELGEPTLPGVFILFASPLRLAYPSIRLTCWRDDEDPAISRPHLS